MLAAPLQPWLAAAKAKVPDQVLPRLVTRIEQASDPCDAPCFREALHVQSTAAAIAMILGGGGEAHERGWAPQRCSPAAAVWSLNCAAFATARRVRQDACPTVGMGLGLAWMGREAFGPSPVSGVVPRANTLGWGGLAGPRFQG